MGAAHAELEGLEPSDVLPSAPLDSLWIRHTVGLSDPILTSEIEPEERLNDRLPQSLEEYVDAQKLRYFKVKVCGDDSVDLPRLQTIAELLDARAGRYVVSLDGNEQYVEAAPFRSLVETLRTKPVFEQFFNSIRYIEQPIHRDAALKPSIEEEMRELSSVKPVIIDESDSGLDTFKQALEIGYRGVSSKNCKGVYKSLLNYALAKRGGHLMTGEDLANAPVVPLHQDCATLAALGISDAERNGHHYLRGLAHLPHSERADCLEAHPRMYAVKNGLPQLNVERRADRYTLPSDRRLRSRRARRLQKHDAAGRVDVRFAEPYNLKNSGGDNDEIDHGAFSSGRAGRADHRREQGSRRGDGGRAV